MELWQALSMPVLANLNSSATLKIMEEQMSCVCLQILHVRKN